VGNDSRRLPFTGKSVTRRPDEVSEQDVGLQVFLERLALEKSLVERFAQGADCVGEDVVEHVVRLLM
jgi:hypothetical protein